MRSPSPIFLQWKEVLINQGLRNFYRLLVCIVKTSHFPFSTLAFGHRFQCWRSSQNHKLEVMLDYFFYSQITMYRKCIYSMSLQNSRPTSLYTRGSRYWLSIQLVQMNTFFIDNKAEVYRCICRLTLCIKRWLLTSVS